MITLNAIIIDDEPLAHDIILDYLEGLPFINLVAQHFSALEALSYLSEHSVDLIFLDINMPKLSGIELLKVMQCQPQVIVTSAYQQYAIESFELEVCDYLVKPYRFERFLKAVNKAHRQHQLIHEASQQANPTKKNSEQNSEQESLFIKVDKQLVQLNIDDIYYLEAYGNYVKVWLAEQMYLTPRTLTSFEQTLVDDSEAFIRIHKSYLVQVKHIKLVEPRNITMKNNQQLPIGKSHKHLAKTLASK